MDPMLVAAANPSLARLSLQFLREDLAGRFRGNLAGAAWTVLAPLMQLAVFYFVFLQIFRARVPGLDGGSAYLGFLALAFWPWFAFSEGIARATTALPDHAALIAKVALPRAALVLARVGAAFLLHGIGFAAVLLLLPLFGVTLDWTGLPLALVLWLPLLAASLGLGFAAAAVQVFVRDLGQIIGHLLQLLFFLTPILYAREMVPERLRAVLDLNPLSALLGGMREAMLPGAASSAALAPALVVCAAILVLGWLVFRRCERVVEDYL